MLIQLANNTTVNSESVISIRLVQGVWTIKMSNSYQVPMAPGEYEWFMKINGNLIEVLPDLSVNIDAIVLFEPNEDGYLIGWEGEPPIEVNQVQGDLLRSHLLEKHQHIILADRITYLEEQQITPDYLTLN